MQVVSRTTRKEDIGALDLSDSNFIKKNNSIFAKKNKKYILQAEVPRGGGDAGLVGQRRPGAQRHHP